MVIGISANSSSSPTAGYRGVWGVETTLTSYALYASCRTYSSGGNSSRQMKD